MSVAVAPIPQYLGANEAETRTGVSHWLWRRYAHEGRIASVKVGRRLLIPVAEIDRIMAEGMRHRTARHDIAR
jgi:predicted site-specific integrase-resolvase